MNKIRNYEVGDEPIAGYRITAFLGSGGFGEVWRAAAPGGTEVAMKILNLAMKGAIKEFRSLALVKSIRHPNLVPILAIWLKDAHGELLSDAAFEEVRDSSVINLRDTLTVKKLEQAPQYEPAELIIAMGIGRKSLADRLAECEKQGLTGIPVDELLNYMQDAARAIDYLNSTGHGLESDLKAIQHCDIKPPNILIVGDAAQVCDFGLAREVDDLRSTSLALSVAYAAPELIESNSPSPMTDQYSLAVSYLELRTGQLPFPPDSTLPWVIQAHLTGKLDLSRLSPPEREIIRRATARQPDNRYPSATDFVFELREANRPPKVALSRRGWLASAAIGFAVLLVVIALTLQIPKSASTALVLPAGFVAAPDATTIDVHGQECPNRILRTSNGLTLPLRLVESRRTGAFYIMENKVSHAEFGQFANAKPEAVQGSDWSRGPCSSSDSLTVAQRDQLPVFRVTCAEASRFASWIGGELPTVDHWDAAAGRFEVSSNGPADPDRGPLIQPWDKDRARDVQVAVNRGANGPLPVGVATHDVSAFGCRDMAGNGNEWTRTSRDAADHFSADEPDPLMTMILRGHSYLNPAPLVFKDLDDRLQDETRGCLNRDCDLGFRVVFELNDWH